MSTAYFPELLQKCRAALADLGRGEALLLLLDGPLGVGKTQFVKELLASYNYREADVQSPTFLKLIEHQVRDLGRVLHMDLYRMDDVSDLDKLDLEAYEESKVLIVEWPQLFLELLARKANLKKQLGISKGVEIQLTMDSEGRRAWIWNELF